MKIFHDPGEIRDIPNAVVTTGSFDGVHIGHKSILKRLCNQAKTIGGESVLITFHPHPRKILFPETAGKNLLLINSQQEKIELLEKTGLDNLLVINFTIEFSKMTSFDFIRKILVGNLEAKKVIVGFNHHFGHNQEGGYEILYELGKYHGFAVEEIPEQDIENETVSSTRIRKALMEGKIQRANAYLDHYYQIIGQVTSVGLEGNETGFSAYHLSIEEDCKLIPPEGTYAVSMHTQHESEKGLVYIENREQQGFTQNLGRYVVLIPFCGKRLKDHEQVHVDFHKLIRETGSGETQPALGQILRMDMPVVENLIY